MSLRIRTWADLLVTCLAASIWRPKMYFAYCSAISRNLAFHISAGLKWRRFPGFDADGGAGFFGRGTQILRRTVVLLPVRVQRSVALKNSRY
jgi:hypothetical protein